MNIIFYTDGGSLNNPGQAASAFLLYKDGKILKSFSRRIGVATNNTAEYMALIFALEEVVKMADSIDWSTVQQITAISDSQLMVNQLNGAYKIKHPEIRKYVEKIKKLTSCLSVPVIHVHVLREKNQEADALVKEALGR